MMTRGREGVWIPPKSDDVIFWGGVFRLEWLRHLWTAPYDSKNKNMDWGDGEDKIFIKTQMQAGNDIEILMTVILKLLELTLLMLKTLMILKWLELILLVLRILMILLILLILMILKLTLLALRITSQATLSASIVGAGSCAACRVSEENILLQNIWGKYLIAEYMRKIFYCRVSEGDIWSYQIKCLCSTLLLLLIISL